VGAPCARCERADGSGSAGVFRLSGEDERDQAAWLERVGSD